MLSPLLLLLTVAAAPQRASEQRISPTASAPACGAMTAIQIEAAVGKRLGPGKEEQSAMACTRTYSADDISVVISVQHLAKPLNVGAEILSLKAAFPGSKISEVAGIAEHIFVLDIPGAGTQLHVLPDSHSYLLVSVLGLDDGNNGFNAAWKIACALMGKA